MGEFYDEIMASIDETIEVTGQNSETTMQERFDYTKWQREYFDSMTKEEMDAKMTAYFKAHPYSGKASVII